MSVGFAVDSKGLLSCFFEECERQFRFLELDHGFRYVSGLASTKSGRQIIAPYNRQIIDPPFWAVTRYERHETVLELGYGDHGYIIEAYIYCGPYKRFAWLELLHALKKDDERAATCRAVKDEYLISDTVAGFAGVLKDNADHFAAPAPALIHKATTIRSMRIQEQIRQNHKRQITKASRLAAKAMARGDYRHVVELLHPHRDHIGRTDRQKLKHAREKLMKT